MHALMCGENAKQRDRSARRPAGKLGGAARLVQLPDSRAHLAGETKIGWLHARLPSALRVNSTRT